MIALSIPSFGKKVNHRNDRHRQPRGDKDRMLVNRLANEMTTLKDDHNAGGSGPPIS